MLDKLWRDNGSAVGQTSMLRHLFQGKFNFDAIFLSILWKQAPDLWKVIINLVQPSGVKYCYVVVGALAATVWYIASCL
jgi:hypothetical protein